MVLAISIVIFWEYYVKIKRNRRFKDRKNLQWEQIYKKFYSDCNLSEELVKKLWMEVAQYLEIPYGMLRPSDRFDSELKPVDGWEFDDAVNIITFIAKERLKKSEGKVRLTDIKTLDDYIKVFSKIEKIKYKNPKENNT